MNTRKINPRNRSPRNRNFKNEQSFWNPLFLQLNFAIEAVKQYFESLPNNQKLNIYDFGCGQKPYQVFASNHNYIGIDIDEKNIYADIYADISKVPVEDNMADIVTSFYVLEHVENPQDILNEKYRVLKKGGELFMLVPLYWEEHEKPYDFFRFTRFGIESIMRKAGFINIEITEVNTNPSILGMHLARFFNRRFLMILVPVINFFFYRLEIRVQKRARENNSTLSNVMTFAVKGVK
jgi:SAM-dependent methyltransferase